MMPQAAREASGKVSAIRLRFDAFAKEIEDSIKGGNRLGLLTARRLPEQDVPALVALVFDPIAGTMRLLEAAPPEVDGRYPSITPAVPQAHWFERLVFDLFGL